VTLDSDSKQKIPNEFEKKMSENWRKNRPADGWYLQCCNIFSPVE